MEEEEEEEIIILPLKFHYLNLEIKKEEGKNQEEKEELNPHPPLLFLIIPLHGITPAPSSLSSPPPKREEGKGEGREGEGRRREGRGGIEIIRNVGNRPPGKRVLMKNRKNMYTSNTT